MGRIGDDAFEPLQLLDAFANSLEVGQHAPQPPLVDEEHARALRFFVEDVGGLRLRSHEEQRFSRRNGVPYEGIGRFEALNRLLKIDDVNAVPFPEDVALHFGIPAIGLVAKMYARFKELLD